VLSLLQVLLLCQCTTQHGTKEFPAFYRSDPPGYLSPEHVYERATLENSAGQGTRELKRLQGLYELERSSLSKDSPRLVALQERIRLLNESTDPLYRSVSKSRRSITDWAPKSFVEPVPAFSNGDFKGRYSEVYKLWNRDENVSALDAAQVLLDESADSSLSDSDRLKILNLRFRIALDVQNLSAAQSAYDKMRDLDECAVDTASAGFLLALTFLGAGSAKQAESTFSSQCDPDESSGNLLRRKYWLARFEEANGSNSASEYLQIAESGVPGYYTFLAHLRLRTPMVLRSSDAFSYRKAPLTLPSSMADLLIEAESCLRAGLRLDAAVYLRAAAAMVVDGAGEETVPSLLYLAHLFNASGSQLDAMKLYALVTEIATNAARPLDFDFLSEMFPRPHSILVDQVARDWQIEPDFLFAIMRQESAFNPSAVSQAGAQGLMQMMPALASQIAKEWKYDPYFSKQTLFFANENLKFSAYHIHQLHSQMPHPALMAAAYNAGAKRVSGWWKRGSGLPLDVFIELIPVNETRNYVKLVLRNYVYYKLLRNKKFRTEDLAALLPSPSLP
jgi:soluble lytic murein transglycosylase-like protein